MIRQATHEDIPAIVEMVRKLHATAGIVLPMDQQITGRFLNGLVASPIGLLLVANEGFLAASVGTASISMLPVAIEHGWWAEGGDGLKLLRRYEVWAREQGCFAARMSTPPGADRVANILDRSGFSLAEQAWVKVL
jgi:N-acetylglutamate synthase-like GNAT family acetyltransferase